MVDLLTLASALQKVEGLSGRLRCRVFEAVGELIGALQESGLQVSSIGFKVSDTQRQTVENEMITQVTESFKLVTLAINSNTNAPAQPYYGNAMMESSAASEPVPIAGDEQRIEMIVKGVIELVK